MTRIGITTSQHEWPQDEDNITRIKAYIAAVEDAGAEAEPLWLPADESAVEECAKRVAQEFGGLLISGGADLPPLMYEEETLLGANVQEVKPLRPHFELALLREFVAAGKPILGICYGCQLLNVWRGGSLLQDIAMQWEQPIAHSHEGGNTRHTVRVLDETKLKTVVGLEEFDVVSSHHQAIANLAEGAQTSAFAPDRLAEAIEFDGDEWILGVQWHPERDREGQATQRLFKAFVEAARL
jgi:putative glutamine amidotransferase